MERLKVVAVVPVFQRPTVVVEALESVAWQRRPPDRLVVVDDGSADDTPARVGEWLALTDRRFEAVLVRQTHAGVSAARNRGLAEAPGADLVAFLDSDDLWDEDYLELLVAALEARPRAVAATCDKRSVDAPSGRERRGARGWVAGAATTAMIEHGPPGISNTVFCAASVRAAGGFDCALHTAEDLDLMLRVSLLGEWLYVPGAHMTYRHRLAEGRGEAPALAHWHPDRRRTRAEVVEQFLERAEARAVVSERVGRRVLGRLWAKAGRQLRAAGRRLEARACFQRALRAQPLDLRARLGAWW